MNIDDSLTDIFRMWSYLESWKGMRDLKYKREIAFILRTMHR